MRGLKTIKGMGMSDNFIEKLRQQARLSNLDKENAKLKRLLAEACEQFTRVTDLLYALGHMKKDDTLQPTELEQWYVENEKEEYRKIYGVVERSMTEAFNKKKENK
jgi:hypothetical protein